MCPGETMHISDYLRIDRNFCLVHEEITSIRLYTPDWGYFEWTEQIISINPDKLIQINSNFFVMIEKYIYFSKIRQIIGNKSK